MSGDSDLIKLYSQRILALAAAIPLTERLEKPQSTARNGSLGQTSSSELGQQFSTATPARSIGAFREPNGGTTL